eukprot:8037167-Pyramimonas_sp.AAC.1
MSGKSGRSSGRSGRCSTCRDRSTPPKHSKTSSRGWGGTLISGEHQPLKSRKALYLRGRLLTQGRERGGSKQRAASRASALGGSSTITGTSPRRSSDTQPYTSRGAYCSRCEELSLVSPKKGGCSHLASYYNRRQKQKEMKNDQTRTGEKPSRNCTVLASPRRHPCQTRTGRLI